MQTLTKEKNENRQQTLAKITATQNVISAYLQPQNECMSVKCADMQAVENVKNAVKSKSSETMVFDYQHSIGKYMMVYFDYI